MTRVMQLGPILTDTQAFDEKLIHERLVAHNLDFPELSVRLIGYMAWPNDEVARRNFLKIHGVGSNDTDLDPPRHWSTAAKEHDFLKRLKSISLIWAKVADVFHIYYDLKATPDRHRGGASIGKSIDTVAQGAKAKGTGSSTLWENWVEYQDVAHLVTASVCINWWAWKANLTNLWKFPRSTFQLVHIVTVLPDVVLAAAQDFEELGLAPKQKPHPESAISPSTIWRIPENNLLPLHPPVRKIGAAGKAFLKERRAGNRGRR